MVIDGKKYQTSLNVKDANGATTLHGGFVGFDKKLWKLVIFSEECPEVIQLSFTYTSPDGEEGFPGNLKCTVDYILKKKENTLKIRFHAETDQKTVVNLTNHSYFNLSGTSGNIHDHEIQIFADAYLPMGDSMTPTGKMVPVKETPFDLTSPTKIGKNISNFGDEQIKRGNG